MPHHIETHILEKLSYFGNAGFSQLKPPELMNNAFNYHLKSLLRDKLVEKNDNSYKLTNEGLVYVDKLSFKTLKTRQQPKINCTVMLKNQRGDYLLAKRKTEPFLGKYVFINGKQHFGESPEAHVRRELQEQVGAGIVPHYRGTADIRTYRKQLLVSHVTARIYTADFNGSAPPETQKFSYEWVAPGAFGNMLAGDALIFNELEKSKQIIAVSVDLESS